ncbi:MAG: hypothetical protein ACR2OB_12360 [Solirubrobacteraceae bacterium]
MSAELDLVYRSIDDDHSHLTASTRRQMIAAASISLGGLGLLGLPAVAGATAKARAAQSGNDPQTILNVAATAEVLATIVNTVGFQKVTFSDSPGTTGTAAITKRNIAAAAREELIHYDVLVSLGAKPLTTQIWVPDAVFASDNGPKGLLNTVIVGDQIFINAYLIGVSAFGQAGNGKLARAAAEFMGVEAVHRALARQSLGLLGNDRVFMKFDEPESAPGPLPGLPGFTNILDAVTELKAAGFGFGAPGASPGQFYDLAAVRPAVPNAPLNTPTPDSSSLGSPLPVKKPAPCKPAKKQSGGHPSAGQLVAHPRFTG